MIKVAILDDYQNAFQQIVEIEKYKNKFYFKVFNEPFVDEKEAAVELEDFETLFIMRERTPITATLIECLPKLKYIMTSGMRNNAIDLDAAKKECNCLWNRYKFKSSGRNHMGFNLGLLSKYETRNR